MPDDCVDGLRPGLVGANRHFSQSPGLLPAYLIEFVEQWKERGPDERLLDPLNSAAAWEFKDFVMEVDWSGPLRTGPRNSRTVARATLLHLVHPDTFEASLGVDHKKKITERFAYLVREPTDDVDRRLTQIRRGLEAERGRDFDFYDDEDIFKQWQASTGDRWDAFVGRAKSYVDSGRMQSEEIEYKLQIGEELSAVRNAVLARAEDWQDVLKRALRAREGHPITWQLLSDFHRWSADYSEEASSALEALWSLDDLTLAERIRGFSSGLPRSAVRGATGNRTNVISVLLMGVDVEQFPPFRLRLFNEAYDSTGYDRPESEADEAALYEYALTFLDRFIDEAADRGSSFAIDWTHSP